MFQSVRKNPRRTSSPECQPKFRLTAGLWRQKSQRMTSTPILSAASSNQMALPLLLCISSPCSSRTQA